MFWTLSIVRYSKECDDSETESVSVLRQEGKHSLNHSITLCSLEYQIMGKVQKPNNPECYIISPSEPFRIYSKYRVKKLNQYDL
jgi:uncharacterized protein YbbC (DUF1343 family)